MRAIKRAIKRYKKNKAMRPALHELKTSLVGEFGNVSLKQGGDRGRDSIYEVRDDKRNIIGVARLANVLRDRKEIASSLPYRRVKAAERLDYEWKCCNAGFEKKLTPKPLWKNDHAIMVSFCEGGSYQSHFMKNPSTFWEYIIRASKALKQWHSLGYVHMDASLTNVVGDANQENAYLIDFEYIPAEHISPAQARAYDYLRLVESSYKFLPQEVLEKCDPWLQFSEQELDDETKTADLQPLIPAISRVHKDPNLAKVIQSVFTHHGYS